MRVPLACDLTFKPVAVGELLGQSVVEKGPCAQSDCNFDCFNIVILVTCVSSSATKDKLR